MPYMFLKRLSSLSTVSIEGFLNFDVYKCEDYILIHKLKSKTLFLNVSKMIPMLIFKDFKKVRLKLQYVCPKTKHSMQANWTLLLRIYNLVTTTNKWGVTPRTRVWTLPLRIYNLVTTANKWGVTPRARVSFALDWIQNRI